METKLVGYDSGEESDNAEDVSTERMVEQQSNLEKAETNFATEWENFEKLIASSSEHDGSLNSSSADAGATKVTNRNVAGKRVFREAESENSDSDMSVDTTSDNEPQVNFSNRENLKEGRLQPSLTSESSNSPPQMQAQSNSDSESDSANETSDEDQSIRDKSADRIWKTSRTSSEEYSRTIKEEPKQLPKISDKAVVIADNKSHSDDATHISRRSGSHSDATLETSTSTGAKSADASKSLKSCTKEDRIQAKLLAIADSPPTNLKRSRSRSPRGRRPSNRTRSPSPKFRKRSRDRHHGHGRNTSRRSRSRSQGRHRRSRSPGRHRRNRSRSGGRHHKSRRHHSRDRHSSPHYRRRSRDRRRSRTRSPPINTDKQPKNQPLNFKEQMKAQLLNAAQKQVAAQAAVAAAATACEAALGCDVYPQSTSINANLARMMDSNTLIKANEKPSNLPLNMSNPLLALAGTAKDKVTPQQALAQTMAAMHQKAQQLTGVAVPSYYNPAAVNPLKYAEQLKKRKLLWSKAPKETPAEKEQSDVKNVQSVAQWTGSSFNSDSDGKVAAKFRKLMGIREEDKILLSDNLDISKLSEEQRQRQEELFQQLDKEYEFARMTTHTHRGIGLGFQSQGMPDT